MKKKVLHYPRLNTILMVEDVLKNAEQAILKSELLRRLPNQVMQQTLNVILDYLEEKGAVLVGKKGVLWVHNKNPREKKLLGKSIEV